MQHQSQPEELTVEQIYAIISRHRGAATQLAAEIEVSKTTLSTVLRGKFTSKRVLDAAKARALELLESERAEKAAA